MGRNNVWVRKSVELERSNPSGGQERMPIFFVGMVLVNRILFIIVTIAGNYSFHVFSSLFI